MSLRTALFVLSLLGLTTGAALAQTAQPAQPTPPGPGQPARPAPPAQPGAAPVAPRPATTAPAPAATQARKVNLNTATAPELDTLPQIGVARAKDIFEARTKNGRFKSWDDFVARNVIPKNAADAIKDRVSF